MSKNVKIDGRECVGISSIQAFDVDTNEYVSFVDTSDATATADDILKDKTAYVNGEKVIGTGAGGGGDQPVMNAPTISLSGRQLTMNNPSTNGNFFSKFKVFVDNTLKSSQTEKTIDLYTYFNEDGTYNLAAKCAGTNFQDSELSSSVSYTKFTPTGGVVWYGNAAPLSNTGSGQAATTVGNYALFGGGAGNIRDAVDAYDENLTHTIPAPLSQGRFNLAATTVGNYALFGGGSYTTVDAYDENLTHTIPTPLSVSRYSLAATTVGNYALFAGGSNPSDVVDAYDVNLTRTIPTALSTGRQELSATTVGNHAIFSGGLVSGYDWTSTVDAYDTDLTRIIPAEKISPKSFYGATTLGNYALFGGGHNPYSGKGIYVHGYDENLTKINSVELSIEMQDPGATVIGDYALFGCTNTVNAFDKGLTRTIPTGLSKTRSMLKATTVGNYALFGGGNGSAGNIVDVYTIQI